MPTLHQPSIAAKRARMRKWRDQQAEKAALAARKRFLLSVVSLKITDEMRAGYAHMAAKAQAAMAADFVEKYRKKTPA